MKNKIISQTLVILLVFIGIVSCNKYIDKTPLSADTQANFYTNADQVQQALTGVYNAFGARSVSPGFSNPTPYYAKFDLYTEIGLERGLSGTIASGSYDPTNGSISEIWAAFYQVIQRANNLLLYMTKAQGVMTPTDYNRVIAETKVLRAMAYWHLVVFYGDVPLVTAPPTSQGELYSYSRQNKKDIIDYLLKDLSSITKDLDWQPAQQGRVSKGVAFGIAARLAMVDKRYSTVTDLTDSIINSSQYGLNPSYQNLFRKASQALNVNKEIMFIYPFGDADAGSFNYLQLVQGSRNQGGQASHFPSQFLVDLFECTDGKTINQSALYNPARPNKNRDSRMAQTVIVPGDTVVVQGFTSMVFNFTDRFMATYNTTSNTITFPSTINNQDSASIFGPRLNGLGNIWRKYCQDRDINGNAGNLYKVGWIYMRYAEMLLLNAEANLEKGAPATAVATQLNKLRIRASMPVVAPDVLADPIKLKQLVRREKTIELANEGLHIADMRRWDDGAYAEKVMPIQMYGEANSNMQFTPTVGLEFKIPAPAPIFDATYNVPISWINGDALRLKRELRIFNKNQHILCPIPQGERDKAPSLTQNSNW